MKALALAFAAAAFLALSTASPAYGGAQFHYATFNGTDTVSFQETGLGNIGSEHYVVNGTATADVTCENPGGQYPPHWQGTATVTYFGSQDYSANGQVTGTVTVSITDISSPFGHVPNPFDCNWTPTSDPSLTISDTTSGNLDYPVM